MVHWLIANRPNTNAGPAGGACPNASLKNEIQHWHICPAAIVQVISLVDLQGSRREHFSRAIGRTNFLAPETHDASIAVHDLFPAEVFHGGRTELFNGLVVQVDKIQ